MEKLSILYTPGHPNSVKDLRVIRCTRGFLFFYKDVTFGKVYPGLHPFTPPFIDQCEEKQVFIYSEK